MESAQKMSLQTPEILENILLCVDERSLLTSAQRVCKYWHAIISVSPSLQKHLFLKPDWDRKTRSTSNLLTEAFPVWFIPSSYPGGIPQDGICIINSNVSMQSREKNPTVFDTLPLALPHKNEAFMRNDATWRHMLVQQPPIPSLVTFRVSPALGGLEFKGPFVDGRLLEELPAQATHMNSRTTANPLRMGSFYDEVILTTGATPWQWMILRNTGGQLNVPSSIRGSRFKDYEREILEETLRRFGMALVVRQTKQSKKPFLWTPAEHFVWRQTTPRSAG